MDSSRLECAVLSCTEIGKDGFLAIHLRHVGDGVYVRWQPRSIFYTLECGTLQRRLIFQTLRNTNVEDIHEEGRFIFFPSKITSNLGHDYPLESHHIVDAKYRSDGHAFPCPFVCKSGLSRWTVMRTGTFHEVPRTVSESPTLCVWAVFLLQDRGDKTHLILTLGLETSIFEDDSTLTFDVTETDEAHPALRGFQFYERSFRPHYGRKRLAGRLALFKYRSKRLPAGMCFSFDLAFRESVGASISDSPELEEEKTR